MWGLDQVHQEYCPVRPRSRQEQWYSLLRKNKQYHNACCGTIHYGVKCKVLFVTFLLKPAKYLLKQRILRARFTLAPTTTLVYQPSWPNNSINHPIWAFHVHNSLYFPVERFHKLVFCERQQPCSFQVNLKQRNNSKIKNASRK